MLPIGMSFEFVFKRGPFEHYFDIIQGSFLGTKIDELPLGF